MVEFASIPTMYRGTRFRSRLEARWAAMFDLLGWTWDYEPLDLNGWIPDFVLTCTHQPVLVEVKPVFSLPQDVVAKVEKALEPFREQLSEDDEDFGAMQPISKYHEVVIVGATIFRGEYDPQCFGWISDCVFIDWPDAVIAEKCEKTGRYNLTSSQIGWWANRMRGCGGLCCVAKSLDPAPFEDIEALWREAGNRVQWKRPA